MKCWRLSKGEQPAEEMSPVEEQISGTMEVYRMVPDFCMFILGDNSKFY